MSFNPETHILCGDAVLSAKLRTFGLHETILTQGFERLLLEVDAKDADTHEHNDEPQSDSINTLRAVLGFLANCLVGRHETHRGRQAIEQARKVSDAKRDINLGLQTSSKRQDSEQPGAYLRRQDLSSLALHRRDLAYRGLSAVKLEYEVETRRIHELDNHNKSLEAEIRTKRGFLRLLSILKLREESRLERLGESGIISYIRSSRKESRRAMQMLAQSGKPRSSLVAESLQVKLNHNLRSPRHTDNAFANLYRLHAKLVREEKYLSFLSPLGGSSIEERLNLALQRLCAADNDKFVTLRHLINLAGYRIAERKGKTDKQFLAPDEELDNIAQNLEKKSKVFEDNLNRATALEWICETHLQLITVFRTEVGPNLKLALGEQAQRVEGFLDNLRQSIKNDSQNGRAADFTASTTSLQHAIRSIMYTPCINLADEVESKLKRVFESKRLTEATNALVNNQAEPVANLHQVATDIEAAIDTARSQHLLERKSKKADHGQIIGDDVRAMLTDIKRLR